MEIQHIQVVSVNRAKPPPKSWGRGKPQLCSMPARQKENTMANYVLDQAQLVQLLEDVLDKFMDYQFRHGYEEPRAREEALRDVLNELIPEKTSK